MTIKPINSQKSNEKKENHGHNHQESQQQPPSRTSHRNKPSTVEVQGSQLRNDVFDDITARHRRSPHKIVGRSKRDREHHSHLHSKRNERSEHREKIASPQYQASNVVSGSSLLSSPNAAASGNVVNNGNNVTSCKSPKHVVASSATQQQQSNVEEQLSGYNSGDEHLVPGESLLTPDEWKDRDEKFVKAMSERGFIIKDIVEDGACLFRAISLQIYGDQEMHEVIRQQTMDYIYQNREYFAHFVTEDINSYVKRKRNKNSHGNHIEIQAMSEIYNRPVELYCYQTTPINIFNSEQSNNGYDPLRLSYQRGSHYNAILDPYNASVGVGLGLAGYKPESQTREAIRLSEQLEIEQTMFEDKLKTTDWEATNEAIEEQIARESYLQWCRENMQKARGNNCGTSSTVTSAEYHNNKNNIRNETVTSCLPSSSSTSSASSGLKDIFNLGNSSSSINSLKINSSNNNINNNICGNDNIRSLSDATCDREKISEQQQPLPLLQTAAKLTKKKDNALGCSDNNGTSSSINVTPTISLSGSGGTETGNKFDCCSSPCDSDDTDMSSTSSVDQNHMHRFNPSNSSNGNTTASKLSINKRLSLSSKRRHRNFELKRKSLEKNGNDLVLKRSKQCLEMKPHLSEIHTEQQQQQYQKIKNQSICSGISAMTVTTNNDLPSTSKQAETENKPVSQFYQSLLESSYTDDGFGQLSENEMIMKAIEMSRMDFFEEQKRKFGRICGGNKKSYAGDEDSDTLST